MADSAIKTVATDVDVAAFIAAVEPAVRRADAERLCALMSRLSGEPPRLWGPTIIGFGRYRYRYDSGRTGEMCRIGFSPRKATLVIYIVDGFRFGFFGVSDVSPWVSLGVAGAGLVATCALSLRLLRTGYKIRH